ncbi:MAG: SAM-dependent methyltransferase [Thermus sp.]|mgnify:FL=1|uniref:SAM-dependent methyltransferase n=1 Tax=Thermus sp. TaxID=275 RepID=UPI0033169EE8
MPRDWEMVYQAAQKDRPPAFVVRAYAPFLPKGAVLDLAGGLGRNARPLLARGHRVVLVEKSREALRRLSGVSGLDLLELDLEAEGALSRLPRGPFAGIVLSYYVNRPLLQALPPLLAPGGLLLVEGFTRLEAQRRGRGESPFYWEELEVLTPPKGLCLRAFGEGWMAGGYRAWAVYTRPG